MSTGRCEDCGEPAKYMTADGVWLCKGDFELLCEYSELIDEGERSDVRVSQEYTIPQAMGKGG